MRLCYLLALCSHLVHSSTEVSVSSAEAHDEKLCIVRIADNFKVWHDYVVYLLLTLAGHQVVVVRIGRDGACLVVFLQSAQYMLESLTSRHCPVAGAILCSHVWSPCALHLFWHVWWLYRCHGIEVWQAECARTVSHVGVSEQDYWCHMLQRHLRCFVCCIETVCRRCGCHDWHRRFAVTSEECLQKVCLL